MDGHSLGPPFWDCPKFITAAWRSAHSELWHLAKHHRLGGPLPLQPPKTRSLSTYYCSYDSHLSYSPLSFFILDKKTRMCYGYVNALN